MKTKFRFLATTMLVLFTMNCIAQPEQGQRPSIEQRTTRTLRLIEQKIEMDSLQKQVVSDAFMSFFETMDGIIQPGQKPKRELIEEQEGIRDDKIKEVLTTAQYEDYLRMSCRLRPNPREQQDGNRKPRHKKEVFE